MQVMNLLPPRVHRLLRSVRPIEYLGSFFFIVMLVLYWLEGRSFLYVHRLLFWCLLVGLVLFVIFIVRLLFVTHDIRTAFTKKDIIAIVRDWAPLIIFMWVYDNLHDIVRAVNPYDFDFLLATIDNILFFGAHPTALFEKLVHPALTKWLSLNYLLYFAYFPVTLGVLYYKKNKQGFHVASFALVIAMYTGFIFYILFPCVGPILAQHHLHTITLQDASGTFDFYNQALLLYSYYRDYFHCFPSLHVAATAVFWMCSYRYARRLFYIYTPFVLSLWFSTMYLRWHYVIDVIAGFIIAGYAIFIGTWIQAAWTRRHEKK